MRILLLIISCLFFLSASAQQEKKELTAAEFQKKLNKDFRNPDKSPLTVKDRQKFTSLEFFPVDSTYIVEAEFVRTPFETPFQMSTTTERKPAYLKYGELYFRLKGKEYKLDLYQNLELTKNSQYKDYLFLPFTDLTNGSSSYSGGRYVDMRIPKTARIILDFNKTYNPYCAYNGKYSCPIPPANNHLDTTVEAGVKDYIK